MPYIPIESQHNNRREHLRNGEPALNAGELNYQLFYYVKHNRILSVNILYKTIKIYVDNFLGEKPNYQRYNDMTGALVRCYKEINRRLFCDIKNLFEEIMDSYDDDIAQYEDIKIKENSDVE